MTPEETMELENTKQERDEFLDSRNRYANIAHQLADYIQNAALVVNAHVPYPHEAMKQIEIAKGKHGYQWPTR